MCGNQCSLETEGDQLMCADEKRQSPLMLHSCHTDFAVNATREKVHTNLLVGGRTGQAAKDTQRQVGASKQPEQANISHVFIQIFRIQSEQLIFLNLI